MAINNDDDFELDISWLGDTALVALSGEWDLYAKERLHDAMCMLGTQKDVVVDVRDATFFDSSALGELVACYNRVIRSGHRFELLSTNSNMERLLELTGLGALFRPKRDRLAFLQEHLPIRPSITPS
ncbi:MAG: STAS domain-containing protein [Candidatus Eremiobacteraeota bacterium]|nr:STAS domain-containing protein [Candidatus Eremiobacteraeota bacterium]